jgi:stage V sporulation protein AD
LIFIQTKIFEKAIKIIATSSLAGNLESNGPLSNYFDIKLKDDLYGEKSWELAEIKMIKENYKNIFIKSNLKTKDIDYLIAGDLLNQNIASSFAVKDFSIPYIGIYGACSTFGEALSLASMIISGNFANNILVGTSSHFCSAERQFRFPLEFGTQRAPTATWTVTGHGCAILSNNYNQKVPEIKAITIGKIIDMDIKDPNNMGAAMAPAAFETIFAHLKDLNLEPDYYDLIITGDLGYTGRDLLCSLALEKNIKFNNLNDCGILIFDEKTQDTHSGGSGCACSAITFCGYLYNKLISQELNKILLVPTGALMSTTSIQQNQSIPSIAYAIAIEN